MIQMRHIQRAALLVLFVLFFLVITLAVLSVYIPRILESDILPRIAEAAGIEDLSAGVRHIGFHGADIGPVHIGNTPQTTRILDSIQLRYSPSTLYTKRIESVVLKGILLSCEYRDGEFFIQGFDLRKISGILRNKNAGSESTERAPPLSIGRIGIEQATISFKWEGRQIRLPISLEIIPVSPTWQAIDLRLQLYPRDQILYLSAAIDLNKRTTQLTFNAKEVHPEVFSDFTGIIPGLTASGSVDAEGSIQIGFDPIQVRDSLVSIRVRNGNIDYNTVRLKTGLSGEEDRPFHVTFSGKGQDWKLSALDIAAISPIPFHIPQITSTITFSDKGLEQAGDGVLIISPLKNGIWDPLRITEPILLPIHHSAAYSEDKKWSFSLLSNKKDSTSPSDKRIHLTWGNMSITSVHPQFAVSATGKTDGAEGKYSLTLTGIETMEDDTSITIPRLTVNGLGGLSRLSSLTREDLTFKILAKDIKMTAKSTEIHLPQVLMDGRYSGQNGSDVTLKGDLSFSDTTVSDSAYGALIENIKGAIPLAWPIHRPGEKGKISVDRIRWQNLDIGTITAAIQQNQGGFLLDGEHASALFPGLTVGIKSETTLWGDDHPMAGIHCDVVQYHLPSDLAFDRTFPAGGGVKLTGTVDASLKIHLKGAAVTGTLKGKFTDGSLRLKEKNVMIEGIQMGVLFPDLPNLRSAPKQLLRFEKATFGALNTAEGQIDFQVESADSLFIEYSSLKWGGGSLYTHALRIRPGDRDYDLTVYCDRLNLAQLLEQIGSVKAEGSGTVNGRIPIHYSNGKLHFRDGFLYSTPGDGGKIRLTKTEILTAGIPPNTSQYTQLDLAREALKDYDYQWVKLNLETREDILLMGMQLDGKPANPLPFIYKKELGGFARIEAGGEASNFQGIRLDVNFKAPLDKILHYGGTLKDAFGGSQ